MLIPKCINKNSDLFLNILNKSDSCQVKIEDSEQQVFNNVKDNNRLKKKIDYKEVIKTVST